MEGPIPNGGHAFTRLYENNKGNRLEQIRGSLMVVATVIASLTFQIAINPPGGVWQQETNNTQGCNNTICHAGTSVFASGISNKKVRYEIFILLCTISFSFSQAIILLLISGYPLGNIIARWFLIIVTCVTVCCTSGAYIISIWMIMDPLDEHGTLVSTIIKWYARFWAVLICLFLLIFIIRFVYWLLKLLFRLLRRCC